MSAIKCVVITGATGFVGANLTRRLLQEGHDIHLLVRPDYTRWRIKSVYTDLHLHEVNFLDKNALISVVKSIRPDWIFHLATYGAYPWQNDLPRMIQTNIIGTINLVEACLETGFEAFVNTGSSSEYGFKNHAALESDSIEPNSHYAITKASATLFCRHIAKHHNVHIPTLRLYSVYGPYEEPTRLIPTLILQGLNGKLPKLVMPDISRDFIYVEDVVEAYLLALRQPNKEVGAIYNVGAGMQISLRKVVEVVRRIMGIVEEPKWGSLPNRQWDTNIWVADNRKIRKELGWQPQYSFEEGFKKTLLWIKETPEMITLYKKLFADFEDKERKR